MILEIESAYGDMLLFGKHIEKAELYKKVQKLLILADEKNFAFNFCMRHGYEIIPYDAKLKVDYIIDLDTHLIYSPKY